MPITPKRRHNPLMLSYMALLKERGYSSQRLGKVFGVSHSQMYMARERNIGPNNAEKVSQGIRKLLELSEYEWVCLKAEIMGDPEDLLRAYLGGGIEAARITGEDSDSFVRVFGNGPVPHTLGMRLVAKLKEMGDPDYLVKGLEIRVVEKYTPPGRVTFARKGPEVWRERSETKATFTRAKPCTSEAIVASGLELQNICTLAEVGRETLRRAMYEKSGEKTAEKVARVLGRDEDEVRRIVLELKCSPGKLLENGV